jgi:hypothetical protein
MLTVGHLSTMSHARLARKSKVTLSSLGYSHSPPRARMTLLTDGEDGDESSRADLRKTFTGAPNAGTPQNQASATRTLRTYGANE